MKSLQAGFRALGPIIMKSLGPLAIITGIVEVIKFFIDAMLKADKQVTAMAKSFNVTKESAREARDRFFEISDSARRFAIVQKGNILLQEDLVNANLKIICYQILNFIHEKFLILYDHNYNSFS
jgi:hypothetical protein